MSLFLYFTKGIACLFSKVKSLLENKKKHIVKYLLNLQLSITTGIVDLY
ncbi:hypothetical protein Fokcrypt_00384 [Candidatus Fokinia cryptica]|uniref:Uncharacterized protein n=1 Tax=Candidatus Fokinia crypta TaxID=1920990 RepID=A0ABZ0URI5_9RICK|nr:hypothetical protein Fokcrypt_00384 [Candidatus Fokinia cryptica]